MEIQNSSIWREVQKITGDTSNPVHYSYAAQIYVNKKTITPYKVLSIDFVRDFEDNYADETIIEIALGMGTYSKDVYPFKENIEIVLSKTPLLEVSDDVDTSKPVQTERFRATLIDTGNPIIEANAPFTPTKETLDLSNIIQVKFQLVNKAIEQLRMVDVGGIYRNMTVGDVIKAVLTKASQSISVEGVRSIKGVDAVDPISNSTKRDHVEVPHGVSLVQLAQYIHEKCGGVYSSGLGYYLQDVYWYMYPCYDCTRFNTAKNTLTILNIPKNKLPGIERTYRQNGSNLVILATGDVRFKDNSEVEMLNKGNGVRFADANKFLNGFVEVANNKALASRGANNSEFVSVQRLTKLNNVNLSTNPINANSFYESSKLSKRQGSMVDLVWENSNPSLLFPGMMVKMLYLDGDSVKTLDGVLLKEHDYAHMKQAGSQNARYITNTGISVFIKRVETS